MATTADFRNGMCLEFNGKLYTIVQFQHVKPGKGGAFVRTKMKNLETGKILENTFTAGVKINQVRIERRPYQFLYKDDLGYHFMHQETYEQISLNEALVDNADLLKEGQNVEMVVHAEEENVLSCELPPFVEMEITYTEPGLKGDTASSTALKQATVETGATINVPLFVNTGDRIKIDTRTREYSERVK
ncbi:Elongation factor P [anaerobic digester metagenome]|jgi:elongation factor P|nr:elongation factor P [Tenuifilaceae bacterium]HQB77804.1 elongation factor P [Tenuifilaceae bacterium]